MADFRKMRRHRQELSHEQCEAILSGQTHGVLALAGDNGYPYAVPVSYVLCGDKIYFHSAVSGHKVDAIKRDGRVSFCVVEQDDVKAAEFTTYFRSVIVFGSARILEDDNEKLKALRLLAARYSPAEPGTEAEIARGFSHLLMIEIAIEDMTGKESIELVRMRGEAHQAPTHPIGD